MADTTAPRAYRDGDRRWIAGVASGLAEHLGWPVAWTRAGFVVLAVTTGIGVVLYAAYWLLLPLRRAQERSGPGILPLLALGALLLGGSLLAATVLQSGADRIAIIALVVAGIGAAVIWQQADEERRYGRIGLGAALILSGTLLFVFDAEDPGGALRGLMTGLVVAAGLGVLALPWLRRQWVTASTERAERIRADERAEVAAQVHDSVLQTLTLIRARAQDADAVAQLARAEERRLRTWLYQPPGDASATLRPALENLAAGVEASFPVTVEVVCVGDCPLGPAVNALAAAASEALTNAAKHAGGTVSLYAEAGPRDVSVYVRDRGPGFDPALVPGDRLGVRESIIGRMERNGGRADIRSGPQGTEVALTMARP